MVARIFLERRDLGDNLRRLLTELDGAASDGATGACSPPCDVVERPGHVDIIVDVPGIAADSITVLFSSNTVVIAGRKLPAGCGHREAAFHLAERTFGRFARAVHLAGAVDASRAEATLTAGELRITLPRIDERRGGDIPVTIRTL